MRKRILLTVLLALALVLLAACGGGGNDGGEADGGGGDGVGDAARGEELYQQTTIGSASAPGCITCHNLEETDDPLQPSPVGPSHYGVGARAGDYVEGQSAEEYLRESIVNPDAHIVEGFDPGVMYQNYGDELTEQQINDLVAFLLSQDQS